MQSLWKVLYGICPHGSSSRNCSGRPTGTGESAWGVCLWVLFLALEAANLPLMGQVIAERVLRPWIWVGS